VAATRPDHVLLREVPSRPHAIGELFRRHASALERFLITEIRDPAVAAELTAETFACAMRSAGRYRGTSDAEARAWLYGIARNLARHARRRGSTDTRARRRLHIPIRDPRDYFEEAEERLSARTMSSSMALAMESLPENQRTAIQMRVIEELSYAEIAERLACSELAARQRVARALRILKERLA
jgi:RNA polymerase sigma factor (sigma-70 family)